MNLIILVPNVVRRYIASFPEATNNAYKYFNYDNRVVDERVPRMDPVSHYKGPQDLSDMDYDALVAYAQHTINPILAKYSGSVACEDALHAAIRSFNNGLFDGKINASRYNALLTALKEKFSIQSNVENYRHAKKEKPERRVHPHVLEQMGIKRHDVPRERDVPKTVPKGVHHIVRDDKGNVVIKKRK